MSAFEEALDAASRKRMRLAYFRQGPRLPDSSGLLFRSESSLGTRRWTLEIHDPSALKRLAPDIETLSSRALDRNLFFEPEFMDAAILRLLPGKPLLVSLYEDGGRTRRLRFFMPCVIAGSGLPRIPTLRAAATEYSPLGTPMIDRNNPAETLDTLFSLLADPAIPLPEALVLPYLPVDSESGRAIADAVRRLGLPMREHARFERAILLAEHTPEKDERALLRRLMGTKRQKEYARLMRRLQDHGKVGHVNAVKPDHVRDAFEEFLTLENRGWKGRRGTSLYSSKTVTAFARQAVSALADRGRCRILAITLDGRTIASLICFGDRQDVVTWKIAYHPDFATWSPGVQLMLHATASFLGSEAFRRADSLAAAGHAMIDHLWRDRMAVATLIIGKTSRSGAAVNRVEAALARRQKWAGFAKRMLKRLWKR